MRGKITAVRWLCWATLSVSPLLAGCDDDEEATFECSGSTEAAQACCAYGHAVVNYCVRCNPNSERDCVETVTSAIDTASYGEGCEGADGIRDKFVFDNECIPAMQSMTCESTEPPESCAGQILYEF